MSRPSGHPRALFSVRGQRGPEGSWPSLPLPSSPGGEERGPKRAEPSPVVGRLLLGGLLGKLWSRRRLLLRARGRRLWGRRRGSWWAQDPAQDVGTGRGPWRDGRWCCRCPQPAAPDGQGCAAPLQRRWGRAAGERGAPSPAAGTKAGAPLAPPRAASWGRVQPQAPVPARSVGGRADPRHHRLPRSPLLTWLRQPRLAAATATGPSSEQRL